MKSDFAITYNLVVEECIKKIREYAKADLLKK
jgi:hypothetical protein